MKTTKKTLEILEVFLIKNGNATMKEITQETGFDISTVHRILSTLMEKKYIYQSQKRGKYALGGKFMEYSNIFLNSIDIRQTIIPYLLRLRDSTNESTHIAFGDTNHAVLTDIFFSSQRLQVSHDMLGIADLYCTGVGKVFMAYMTKEEFENYIKEITLKRFTPKTITDSDLLKEEARKIRKSGVSFDDEETETGVRNIASGVKNGDGRVIASIGIIGPSTRLTLNRMKKLAPKVKKCALSISHALGYVIGN